MSYLPCMNPSCKSFGQPHPNCKCWNQGTGIAQEGVFYAEGGIINPHYCSENRAHQHDCEHFAEEGIVEANPETAIPCVIANMGAYKLLNHGVFSEISLPKYIGSAKRGNNDIKNAINSLFDDKNNKKVLIDLEQRQKLKNFIEKDGLNEQILDDASNENESVVAPISKILPEHNLLLSLVKGRVYQYLQSLKPIENMPKLAFDWHVEDPELERKYNNAIDIANNPLLVIDRARDGTLLLEHIKYLMEMYPELKQYIDQALTEKITEMQLKEERPRYKTRQMLSLFMGVPLCTEMQPQTMQAAQLTFSTIAQNKQQAQAQTKTKQKGSAPLSKADDYHWTDDQAAERRQVTEK